MNTLPHHEQRAAYRFDSLAALKVQGGPARLRNISDTGIYFESETPRRVGDKVLLQIEYVDQGRTWRLQCDGEVVRVDEGGVAARLLTPFFDSEKNTVEA
jgi:hypothetical protein